jgi:tetratricopeptide (TPR) repeat protein
MIYNKDTKAFLLLSILIFICYCNTFSVPWQFDDPPNITENYPLHITSLQPEVIWNTFFARPYYPGTLERPLSNFSFALNWYIGKDNTLGYHIINLLIHIFTSFFLFKTISILTKTSISIKYTENDIFFISLLSSALWAINPIQTQAVTYIVQRMASMAAMFFILAIYNFIKARESKNLKKTFIHIILCILFFCFSIASKENAITLIPSLLLTEILFLYKKNDKLSNISIATLIIVNTAFFLSALYYAYDNNLLQSITNQYEGRPFTLSERLLTQPSILIFYLTLILYPSPSRLSIDHSFPLSNSLLDPWTTLPAIILIIILIFIAIVQWQKRPLLSYAISFFFINHVIESTIIPLELIFEHRNYLPSLFIFLPLSAWLCSILNSLSKTNKFLFKVVFISISFTIILIGIGTYIRNTVWATEESLWADVLKKAPNSARALGKLGIIYGWNKEKNEKNFATSIALLQKCQNQKYHRTGFEPALIGNIGKVYQNYGMIDQAIFYYKKSLEKNGNFISSRFDLAQALVLQGNFKQALDEINTVITKNDQQSKYFNLKTLILLWLDMPKEAVESAQISIKKTFANKERYFYNTGVALTRAGYFSQGRWFLTRSLQYFPNDTWIYFSLIENYLLSNDIDGAKKISFKLINSIALSSIADKLKKLRTDYTAAPVNVDLITPIIIESLHNEIYRSENAIRMK